MQRLCLNFQATLRLTQSLLIGAIALTLVSCGDGSSGSTDQKVIRTSSLPNIIFILTDDHGYADLGVQGVFKDLKTPHLDQLANTGVRMTAGYVTAPQCTPSRAALMTGRYQQKFGVDDNNYSPLPLSQATLAEKLSAIGYKTGIMGKWHLDVNASSKHWYEDVYAPGSSVPFDEKNIPFAEKLKYYPESRGFQDNFVGYYNNYRANFNLAGKTIAPQTVKDTRFRVDVISDAAVTFIQRHKADPFFLYVPYYAPHVPLEATQEYLDRFPGPMPERRRYALAMLAAVDDGVGRIVSQLETYGIDKDTMIFFIGDNGAPLNLTKNDVLPVSATGGPDGRSVWDGSLNDPWIGEKGMLSEGGIRTPFLMRWKNHLPEGVVYNEPVLSIDAATTAAAIAGLSTSDLDGVNLIPYVKDRAVKPERALYWRFMQQSAIRQGKWKYLRTADEGEYLFDLSTDKQENLNLLTQHPAIANALHTQLLNWSSTLKTPGLPTGALIGEDKYWYDYYFAK
ncbi:MAG TPA: sulfatase-like hydrolase/transferase [Thiolinea sp.]|nr:sulfatase-like hydrolase/transferase [Thiolinea sp.]